MRKKKSTEPVAHEVTVIKNEILKDGPLEEKRSMLPATIKETALGKGVALICDNCYVRDRCPMFKPSQECVFTPEKIIMETAADMTQAMKSLLVFQLQRINQARNIENLDGGYPDGSLSAEIDRFFEIVRTIKEVGDNRDTIEVRARGKGIITQIFGDMLKRKE